MNSRPRHRRLAAVAPLLLALGCASRGPSPGVGDIAFRLSWDGAADLDLYVVDPDGERIDFLHREGESGGRLDIDCNVTVPILDAAGDPVPGEFRKESCDEPLENVFWPKGRAREGVYRVQVLVADAEGARPEDRYRLDVLLGRRVERSFSGSVLELGSAPLSVMMGYPSVAEIAAEAPAPLSPEPD
ncbi:MAG TPA: hypothetical protein VLA66_12740 [Thermoanaerobaculia bacterium]|nr:hypothetical protein [Thermoanaerobaculia bacterium]